MFVFGIIMSTRAYITRLPSWYSWRLTLVKQLCFPNEIGLRGGMDRGTVGEQIERHIQRCRRRKKEGGGE